MPKLDKSIVLVAEDDSKNQLMLLTAFQQDSVPCDLRFTADDEQLMDYLMCRGDFKKKEISQRPKAIVLGLNKPKENGRMTLKEIRETPNLKSLPVVVLSSSKKKEDAFYCKELGVSKYFVKPKVLSGWLDIADFVSKLCSQS